MKKNILTFFLIILVCFIYLTITLQIVNSERVFWGVKIADFRLNERGFSTAQTSIENKWNDFVNQEIVFTYQDKTWPVKLIDLGFKIDARSTLDKAYQIGRQSNALINLSSQIVALTGKYNLEPVYEIKEEEFQNKTTELFKNIEKPAQNASLVFNEEINDFSLEHSSKGNIINRNQLLADLSKNIKSFSNESINLQLILDRPLVENDEIDSAQKKAQQILANQPYQLTFESARADYVDEKRYWTIDKGTILDWLKFEPIKEENSNNEILGVSLDNDKVNEYLNKIALTIDQPPINAQLETEGNRAIVFIPPENGFEVKKEQTIEKIFENILADPPIKKTAIIADKAIPKILLRQTNKLGINTLLGQGTSNFAGSPKNRIHNIKTGTAKFNGLILNPGEEFSFNTLLGESGPEQGFLAELVIKKNKTVPEYGGGLCQVSTTVFRSAVNSGLEITQRTNHSFPVAYYNPQGFDATVYDPYPDFRFINNTPNHLLIEAFVQGTYLTFNFYGTDDGREIKIKGPYILEKNEDGSMKAVLTQEIYQNGELINKQVFSSNYKSPDLYPIENEENEE
ncbi:MAG: VanW family protein [Candidatus Portnoybacteria bacterium]|nr:VanW family protein [Candidatus Portnoybacteria bacterium]